MADTDRIKRNLSKMIDQGAPESDLNAYLGTEGFKSPDEWRAAIAAPVAKGEPTAGGVQDWEPIQSRQHVGTTERPQRTSDWVGSRLVNAATGMLGIPRALADATDAVSQKIGVGNALSYLNPVTAGQKVLQNISPALAPSTEDMRGFVRDKIGMPTVNTPGDAGKILDTGVEAAIGGASGGPRAMLPMLVGGAASEAGGQATKGTPWEPVARIGGALLGGGGTAFLQNVAGNVGKAVTNALASNTRNVDKQAARIVGRGLERDNMTFNALQAGAADLPPGTPVFVAGGENTKGALRGSTAAPGPARTTVSNAEENFLQGSDKAVTGEIDKRVSRLPPLSTRVNTLEGEQSAASKPAYQAAGIPDRIVKTGTEVTPTQLTEKLKAGQPMTMAELRAESTGRPLPGEPTFNTPNIKSEAVDTLLRDSKDMQAAIGAARRLPEFKDLPQNSMAMLDKAYKHLNGMEREAIIAGNGTRAHDLNHLRTDLKKALVEANPKYGEALAAYSEPQQLIDAANLGKEIFQKNIPADEAKRLYTALKPDAQQELLGGVAEHLRTKVGGTDRGVAAERIWNNQNTRDRLQAILPPEDYAAFEKLMEGQKGTARAFRDVNRGSRTTPMALEAEDNASTAGVVGNVLRGRFGRATLDVGNALVGRIGEGRTQAVNAKVADWLTSTDPKQVGLVNALIEKARVEEIARRTGRRNALTYGAFAPTAYGANQ